MELLWQPLLALSACLVGKVALTHQHRLWLYQVIAIWVDLQADAAAHICRIDVYTLPAVYGTTLPHHHVATILCTITML